MQALIKTSLDWYTLVNDVFSYRKEMREGDMHNAVLVMRRFLDCGVPEAIARANDLATSRLHRFEDISTAELPAAELSLDTTDRESIDKIIHALRNLIAGSFQAQLAVASSRYGLTTQSDSDQAADLPSAPAPYRLPSGPTGLGTAASRIGPAPAATAPPVLVPAPSPVPSGPTGLGTAAARIGSAS